MHWAAQYIGKHWRNGGRGPDEFDCWGLVWWIYLKHLNIKLPLYPIDAKDVSYVTALIDSELNCPPWVSPWRLISQPQDLCGVLMATGKIFTHCGIYLSVDGGLILHALDGHNVVATAPADLKKAGWGRIEFYHHGEHR